MAMEIERLHKILLAKRNYYESKIEEFTTRSIKNTSIFSTYIQRTNNIIGNPHSLTKRIT